MINPTEEQELHAAWLYMQVDESDGPEHLAMLLAIRDAIRDPLVKAEAFETAALDMYYNEKVGRHFKDRAVFERDNSAKAMAEIGRGSRGAWEPFPRG